MRITRRKLEEYIKNQWGSQSAIRSMTQLGGGRSADVQKGFGYGSPILIELLVSGKTRKIVLETMRPGPNGHEHMSDRAHAILWDYNTYNHLPRHVRALDVGAFTKHGEARSVADAEEFFVITGFVEGREYQFDLGRIARTGKLERVDTARTNALVKYLVEIHKRKKRDAGLYRRASRPHRPRRMHHGRCRYVWPP